MTLFSIRLNDKLLQEIKTKAQVLHLSQTDYVRQAIERMNKAVEKKRRLQKLVQASLKVRRESMKVNKEFSNIEYDPKA